MRRILPLAVSALVVLAACTSDDDSADDSVPEITLESIPPVVDRCDEDAESAAAPSSAAGTEAGATATNATESTAGPETTESADATTDGAESSESSDAATDGSDSTEAADSTDDADPAGDPDPTDDQTANFVRSADTTEPADSTEPVATTEPAATTDAASTETTGTATGDTGSDSTDDSEPTDSAGSTASSDVEDDPFGQVPNVELPDDLPEELARTVLEEGPADGRQARDWDNLEVYYVGVLSQTGEQFDTNYGSGTPLPVQLGQGGVIQGWDEGLVDARPGDRIQLDIPSDLAYGDQGSPDGGIPPGSALTFVIDVVDVVGPPEFEIPIEAPAELERTVLEEGPADGREAQNFDTVSLNLVAAVGEPNEPADTGGSTEPGDTETDSTEASDGTDSTQATDTDDTDTDDTGTDSTEATDTDDTDTDDTDSTEATDSDDTDADSTQANDSTQATDDTDTDTDDTDTDTETGSTGSTEATEATETDGTGSSEPTDSSTPGEDAESRVGEIFASTFGTDQPLDIPVGTPSGIAGLDEGIIGAKPGDIIQLDIPAELGLGAAGSGDGMIPANSSLTIVVEVLDVTGPPMVDVPDEIPTELVVTEIEPGAGTPAEAGDTVFVNFVGVLTEDGTRFQTNFGTTAYPVVLGEEDPAVIEGWQEGLLGVTEGEQLQLDVPAELAYGAEGSGEDVPADAAVSFLIDVVGVSPANDPSEAPVTEGLPIGEDGVAELVTDDLVVGDGAQLQEGQDAVANVFVVCADTGNVIDNSWDRDQPEILPTAAGQIIDGLRQGIIDMRIGGRRVISVPAELAMGESGSADLGVGTDQDLIFVVELYAVLGEPPPSPDSSLPTDSSDPAASGPDSTGPDSSGPDSSGPDSSGPDSSGPDSSGPDGSGPDESATPTAATVAGDDAELADRTDPADSTTPETTEA